MKKFWLVAFICVPVLSFPFGKNKINYHQFNWIVAKTPRFDIMLTVEFKKYAPMIAGLLEKISDDHERVFNHELSLAFPVVIYPSRSAFRETNILMDIMTEGLGGFTERIKGRVVVPYEGNLAEFRHVLAHELVHAFQYDILYGRDLTNPFAKLAVNINVPLWFMEGMAEYFSEGWSPMAEVVMRDAVINGYLPPLKHLSGSEPLEPGEGYLVYKAGESFLRFLGENFGKREIARLLRYIRSGVPSPFRKIFGFKLSELETRWRRHLVRVYFPSVKYRYAPGEKNIAITGGENSSSLGVMNLHPVFISTNYDIAYITDSDIYPSVVVSSLKGEVKKVIVSGKNDDFLILHPLKNNLSVSKDGEVLAFVSEVDGIDRIHLYDLKKGEMLNSIAFKGISEILSPELSDDGSKLVFSGLMGDREDIFVYELKTGKFYKITDDLYFDTSPRWSPDGRKIYFVSNRWTGNPFSYDTAIYVYDFDEGTLSVITNFKGIEGDLAVSPDGNRIAFTSTAFGGYDIFILNLETKKIYRFTSLIGGAFQPSWSMDGKKLVFSVYDRMKYQIYYRDYDEKKLKEVKMPLPDKPEEMDFKPLSRIDYGDYSSEPTMDWAIAGGVFSSEYGFTAMAQMSFSDMLGDRRLFVMIEPQISSQEKTVNIMATYGDFKHRTDWYVSAYYLKDYLNYLYDIMSQFYEMRRSYKRKYGLEAGFLYPFSVFSRLEVSGGFSHHDYYKNGYTQIEPVEEDFIRMSFVHDSTIWGGIAPVKGTRYIVDLKPRFAVQPDSVGYTSFMFDYRTYALLGLRSSLAFRFFSGIKLGSDSDKDPFYLGGIDNLRGYPFNSFSGNTAVVSSMELRFVFIDQLRLGFPFPIEFPKVFGSMFIDFGLAWNHENTDSLVLWKQRADGQVEFEDLKSSVGFGFKVFLTQWFPVSVEIASPFTGYSTLPVSKWRTIFTLGVDFYF